MITGFFLLRQMTNEMQHAITCCNVVTASCHEIEEGVTNLLKSIIFICAIIVLEVRGVVNNAMPIRLKCVILQHVVFVILKRKVVLLGGRVKDQAIKGACYIEDVTKASFTVINWDILFYFMVSLVLPDTTLSVP